MGSDQIAGGKKLRYAIVDLQYGSTGKGQLAGELAIQFEPDVVACAFTPNAGHTFVDKTGGKHVHRAIPNGIVSPKLKKVLLGPGAVLDVDRILVEWSLYDLKAELIIHPNAVILEDHHRTEEAKLARIGSTMKGTSEALMAKMRRDPKEACLAKDYIWPHDFRGNKWVVNAHAYMEAWEDAQVLQIEGTQGYSLSMHHGFWPYVTAKDTTVMQLLADVAIPQIQEVWGTLRTFPIRVANRPQGTSGPCYSDQHEIKWSELGIEPELTTVTKLPRRIFTFSEMQIIDAIRQNRCTHLFVNFLNYLKTEEEQNEFIQDIEDICPNYCQIGALGYGPNDVRFV